MSGRLDQARVFDLLVWRSGSTQFFRMFYKIYRFFGWQDKCTDTHIDGRDNSFLHRVENERSLPGRTTQGLGNPGDRPVARWSCWSCLCM